MGTGAAPAMDCGTCGRTIGKAADHYLLENGKVLCHRCLDDPAGHGKDFPGCPEDWHDLFDHCRLWGSRAAVAAALGAWPVRKDTESDQP